MMRDAYGVNSHRMNERIASAPNRGRDLTMIKLRGARCYSEGTHQKHEKRLSKESFSRI